MVQERIKTSFIPKTALVAERTESVRKTTFGVVNVIAGVLLIAAIIGAAGLFAFEKYVEGSIGSKRTSLDRARAAFQPATIKELSRLDTRLAVGATLLSQHVAPSVLFDFIEQHTLASVRFQSFSYTQAGPGRMVLAMSGEAKSFNAVALQSDAFGKSSIFSEVIFSNLNIDSAGDVIFDFSAVVNINELAYRAHATRTAAPDASQNNDEDAALPDTPGATPAVPGTP